jgi:hypothetical protein
MAGAICFDITPAWSKEQPRIIVVIVMFPGRFVKKIMDDQILCILVLILRIDHLPVSRAGNPIKGEQQALGFGHNDMTGF